MKQIQGRLKSFGVRTTQGEWTFDVSAFTGAAAAQPVSGAAGQPQPSSSPQPGGSEANPAKNNTIPPLRIGQNPRTEARTASTLPQSDDTEDDNVFMDPPPRQPVAKKQCINPTAKPANNPAKYARAPTVRCAPSTFNLFVDHLTLQQRRRIKAMGFDGLLCVSAERLESRELLKFLFNKLDPKTMVINVTKEKCIHVTPFVVKQVLGLPDCGKDLVFYTHTQASKAFSAFKTLLGLHESHDMHASHLQNILIDDLEWGSGLIDDDMAIRFFFIIACNKLLFPSTDNNIRCKDIYLTRDLSSLPAFNWCKAVVDDLREAALAWHADKAKKSFSGCALLLIILYLDNLECQHQIDHTGTPRVKYFDQSVIKKLISADRTKDQQGKATFGTLPLRDNIHTCYHTTQHPNSNTPPSIEPIATTHLPTMQAQLQGLVDQISGGHRKSQAMLALANFDAKAKKASSYMSIGQQMLRDAHMAAIRTLQTIANDQMLEHNSEYHDNQPPGCDSVQTDDADMYDDHNTHNVGSQHESGAPIMQPAGMGNDTSSGQTNIELAQGVTEVLEQNMPQQQVLPPSEASHAQDIGPDKEMEDDLSLVCTQSVKQAPDWVAEQNPFMGTDVQQEAAAHDTDKEGGRSLMASVVQQTAKPVLHVVPQHNDLIVTDGQQLPETECTTDDALGPILLRPCTQDQTIHARPQRLTKRPAMYVSPFKGDPQRAKAPMAKAHAVSKKFLGAMKAESELFIRYGLTEFNGLDIKESFLNDEWLSIQFMSYFVACFSHDERHLPDGGGYRVFLSQQLGEYVNVEEDEDYSQWESQSALAVLHRDIADIDPTKVKLYLLPVFEEDHYSVYCINFIHDRIDVLDSSPADQTEYHQVLGDRIIRRLNLLFQLATDYTLKQFTRFKRPIIDVCVQTHDNDCGFYALKFMELWNGDHFHMPIVPEKIRQYRSQLLFYGLYHTINEIKKLPAGLEAYRPRQ